MKTLIDERKYPSTRRGSTAKYLCKKWSDGTYTCDCPGWRFKQPDKPRGCSHCVWFPQDYWLVTIADASAYALRGAKYQVITTYGKFLYLVRFNAGETFRPVAPRPIPAVSVADDEEFEMPQTTESIFSDAAKRLAAEQDIAAMRGAKLKNLTPEQGAAAIRRAKQGPVPVLVPQTKLPTRARRAFDDDEEV